MTIKTSVDLFNRDEAVRLLDHLDNDELYHALARARWSATESYNRQMALSEEVTRSKHSIDVLTKLNNQYVLEMDKEDKAWRQYEIIRYLMLKRELFDEYTVPLIKFTRR